MLMDMIILLISVDFGFLSGRSTDFIKLLPCGFGKKSVTVRGNSGGGVCVITGGSAEIILWIIAVEMVHFFLKLHITALNPS